MSSVVVTSCNTCRDKMGDSDDERPGERRGKFERERADADYRSHKRQSRHLERPFESMRRDRRRPPSPYHRGGRDISPPSKRSKRDQWWVDGT